jgi:hypothetical protein
MLFEILGRAALRDDPAVLEWLARPDVAGVLRGGIYKDQLIDLQEWAREAAKNGNTDFLARFAKEWNLTGFTPRFWGDVVASANDEATWDWYDEHFLP